jgi:predicted MFS family arabinose efflux permease
MASKSRSLHALDALNFCNAGIQTGLGPFTAIYYATGRHWNPGQIGMLLGVQSLAGVVSQTAIGHAIDETKHKVLATAMASFVVVLGCMGIIFAKSIALQAVAQAAIGVAVTVFPATTSAFALGMVEPHESSGRIARNETCTHAGNIVFALIAGAVGELLAVRDIFIAAAAFAAGMGISAIFIQEHHVNYETARAGKQGDSDSQERKGWRELIRDRSILVFTAVVVLFNVGNMSTLSLVGQLLSKKQHSAAVWQIAACVVVAEIVMTFVAKRTGRHVDSWGRKPLFVGAFAVLAARNALTNVSYAQGYLISLQALDGVAAGIYGVLLTVVAADLARGSGRFNFLQGSVQSAMGLGGFLSNLLFGFVARSVSFAASFWGLAAAAAAGGLLYFWKMPETNGDEPQH